MEITFPFLMEYLAHVGLKLYADEPLPQEKPLVCIAIYLLYSLELSQHWLEAQFIVFYFVFFCFLLFFGFSLRVASL